MKYFVIASGHLSFIYLWLFYLTVDVSRAGRGTLNLSITASGRDIKYDMKEITSGIYEVIYVPHTDHPHKIDVYYNGHQAPGELYFNIVTLISFNSFSLWLVERLFWNSNSVVYVEKQNNL